ncbi:transcriptional regulator GlxA family with amidase domain [Natronocella acetinitrilica]|uniref:Transcriptional regulator GlxA family with amidase domain n=1 Tax=Natronocella acetinitrilica TaxID=414046 RepID=A0AAE3KA65_9GAMM|nr:DJ-1/PfpI family protein [Natronocella acetinitrilica]MCP1673820.1 transcriptional regulator GlxA family with amidase domain [Natronocella acetinitrilica]
MQFGVFVYEGVEPIDLATFGVLSMARRVAPQIEIVTIAPEAGPVILSNGLTVLAQYSVDDAPPLAALIVTGGPGWQDQTTHAPTLRYLRQCAENHLVASVCTGAMILAASGVLDGHTATTKREVIEGQEAPPIDLLAATGQSITTIPARFVDEGTVITGGGVSLCIDTTLHLLERMLGQEVAAETARIIEYGSAMAANENRLPARRQKADQS